MTTEQKPKKNKSITLIIIESIIMDIIITILFFMGIPNHFFSSNRIWARQKACYSNLRVIQGAIEMYNMDNSIFITEYNEESEKKLIEGKYLKEKPYKPEYSCSYGSKDDLSKDGVLFCEYHGAVVSDVGSNHKFEDDSRKIDSQLLKKNLICIGICLGPGFIYMLLFI